MTKIAPAAFVKVTLMALVLFYFSSMISQQRVDVPIYDANEGNGVAIISSREGFPINYISDSYVNNFANSPNQSNGYSVVWIKLLLNSVFWLFISFLIFSLYRRLRTKK